MSTTISRANKLSVLSPWLDALNGDAVARRLAVQSVQVLLPLSKVCALVVEGELWRCAGASSLHDFTREQLERTGKWLRGHASLHEAIQRLPGLRVAVTGSDGGAPIGLCKAMLVGRVATESTLRVWAERARRLSVGRLREMAREVRRLLVMSSRFLMTWLALRAVEMRVTPLLRRSPARMQIGVRQGAVATRAKPLRRGVVAMMPIGMRKGSRAVRRLALPLAMTCLPTQSRAHLPVASCWNLTIR
ncbi:MAG: hypothetical protein U0V87_12620 [Acidobacteriota bacterium]